jgi:hypothetical protein
VKNLIILTVIFTLLTACVPITPIPDAPVPANPSAFPVGTPSSAVTENPYAPQPGDDNLTRGSAFMNSADLLLMESFQTQVAMILRGNLPSPCHNLRVVINPPDGSNNIDVTTYSVADPNAICAQVLQSFEASIPLGTFPPGHYTVSVNGEHVGEFDA